MVCRKTGVCMNSRFHLICTPGTESLVRKKGSAREYPSWAGFEENEAPQQAIHLRQSIAGCSIATEPHISQQSHRTIGAQEPMVGASVTQPTRCEPSPCGVWLWHSARASRLVLVCHSLVAERVELATPEAA